MLAGASALGASSREIALAFPELMPAFRWALSLSVAAFAIGILFSAVTWIVDRRRRT